MYDAPIMAALRKEVREQAEHIAVLEASINRVERLMDSWAVEGFAGSDELAGEVRAALEGGEDE